MKPNTIEIIINIITTIIVLLIIITIGFLVLQHFAPFYECKDKPDNYIVIFDNNHISCGELNRINCSLAGELKWP